jgi:hypothetical protein
LRGMSERSLTTKPVARSPDAPLMNRLDVLVVLFLQGIYRH